MTNIEVRIRSMFDNLSPAEKCIASFLLENRESVFREPIGTLAAESGVSQVAWVRFCKTLGFNGLKDMKKQLFAQISAEAAVPRSESSRRVFADLKDHATLEDVRRTIRDSSIRAIEETIKLLELDALAAAAEKIIGARSVKIFGVGASAIVAEDLFAKLIRIDVKTFFSRDLHLQLTYAANFSPGDVAVIISNSGRTREMLEILDLAKRSGTPTIAVTKYTKSPLVDGADLRLFTSAPEAMHRSGAMSSRIAQLVVVDALYTAVASRDYARVERSLEDSFNVLNARKATD